MNAGLCPGGKRLQAALVEPDVSRCDGLKRTSHCNNMSILVPYCLALSHHCVCSKSTGSLLCVRYPLLTKEKGGMCFPSLSRSMCPSTD